MEEEYKGLVGVIEGLRAILAPERLLLDVIKEELVTAGDQDSSPRKSEISHAIGEFRMEDVIPNEGMVITISHLGFIKRTRVADYRSQKRGGKGVIGTDTYEQDFVEHLFTAQTHDYILFITTDGQCMAKKVYQIPEGSRVSKGKSVKSFLALDEGEKIAAMLTHSEFDEDHFLVMATKSGQIKKTALAAYTNSTRESGLIGINLAEGDSVIGCVLTDGSNEIILVSHQGLAVRFLEKHAETGDVLFRATGRATSGVTGMRFKRKGDYLQAIEVVDHEKKFLVASEAGLGVRTRFEDYRLIKRGGTGVTAINLPADGSVALVGALGVKDTDEIMLLTSKGQSVRCPINTVRETNRGAKGVKRPTLGKQGDSLLSMATVV